MDDLVNRLADAAAVVSKNGITKSRDKYAELYREAAREITRLNGGLHHVERMADGNSAPWHIADCTLERRPIPRQFCAEEFAETAHPETPMAEVVGNPLPPLLQSICAQLRHPGNAVGHLGEQAAGAIESMWRDNRELTRCLLQIEQDVRHCMNSSANIDSFKKLRPSTVNGDSNG